jgi:hypothetical protein
LDSSEYTASTGTSIVFNTNCVVGDKVEVVAYTYNATGFTGVGGSGTTNTIAKWTASGTLNNSQIFDNGTNVGIGNTNTTYKFDVTGNVRFSGANYLFRLDGGATSRIAGTIVNTSGVLDWGLEGSAGGQLFTGAAAYSGNIGTSSATSFNLCSNSTVRATITSAGNVGIGTIGPTAYSGYVTLTIGNSSGSSTGLLKLRSSYNSGDGAEIYQTPSGSLIFNINSSTGGMSIKSGGEVGIGVTPVTIDSTWKLAQVGNLALMGPSPGSDKNGIIGANAYYNGGWKRIIASYANYVELNQGAGNIQFYTGGTGAADGIIGATPGPYLLNGGVSWTNGSSDVRKKKNFEPSQGLAELLQIEPVKYHFNWDDDNAKKRLGFKAQNLQNIIPEMVIETDELAEDGTNYLTITPDYLLPVLVKAIQEQNQLISELRKELDSLKQLVK